MGVQVGNRPRRNPQRRHRPDDQLEAQRLEVLGAAVRGAAEFRHVGQQRAVNRGRKGAEVVVGSQGFGKDDVGPGLPVQAGALDGVVETQRRGIGAGNDLQVRAGAPGSGDFARHVVGIDQPLVVEVAAFLRQYLVFDLHRGGAGVLQLAHQTHDVERLAVAGIAVHQHRQASSPDELASGVAQFFQGNHAEVGQGHRRAERRAGKIQRLEAGALREAGRKRVVRARHADNARLGQQGLQAFAGGTVRLRRGIKPWRANGIVHRLR